MRAVAEVGLAVSSSLDPQRALNLIVEHACRLLHTERSALAVLELQEDTGGFRFVAIRGLSEEFSQRLRPRH
jgi:GAF domain-containing protein